MQQTENNNFSSSPQNQQPAGNDEINLLDLLLVLAKHWKMIVGGAITAGVLAAGLSMLMPNIYTAKTLILPGDDDNGGIGTMMMAQMGGLASLAGGLGGPTKTDLYITMLKNDTLQDQIIDRFKLMDVYKTKYRENAYASLDKLVAVSAGKKDGVITIAVDDKDPKRAAAVANAYVEELGKMAAKLNTTGAGKNRIFLEERLSKAKVDLAEAEEGLKIFQTKNKAISVTDQAKATLEGVAQLRAQLVAQQVQLSILQGQFTDSSQEVKSVKTAIANLQKHIAQFEAVGPGGSMPGVGSMPQLGQEYMRLMRNFKIQETLVELLTKQYEMNKLNEAKDLSPFQVLQKATVPELKSKPKRGLIVIMAAFVTGFFMMLLSFARDYGSRMSTEDRKRWRELQKLLPLPRRNRSSY